MTTYRMGGKLFKEDNGKVYEYYRDLNGIQWLPTTFTPSDMKRMHTKHNCPEGYEWVHSYNRGEFRYRTDFHRVKGYCRKMRRR